ncbi:PAS domain S-box protein [bacterium]|nr:PAS domain S-box protein [bacterium]
MVHALPHVTRMFAVSEPSEIAEAAAETANSWIGPCRFLVELKDETGDSGRLSYAFPLHAGSASQLQQKLTDIVWQSGKPSASIAGIMAEFHTPERSHRRVDGIAFPLESESGMIGVIAAVPSENSVAFDSEDIEVLQGLARLLTIALLGAARHQSHQWESRIRDRQESELKSEVQRWVDILHNSGDLIQATDAEGRFLFCNHTWHQILGYPPEERESMTVFDVIHPSHREDAQSVLHGSGNGESTRLIETLFVTASGQTVPVEGRVRVTRDNGQSAYIVGIFRDMTERNKMEQDLSDARARAQYMEGIHQAAVTLQHEINNPLTALMGHAELLDMMLKSHDDFDKAAGGVPTHVTAIEEQGQRIAAAVRKMRALYDPATTVHPTSHETGAIMIDLHNSN